MTDTINDLPEHQYYYLLKNGEFEPTGPYSSNQLLQMHNAQEIRSSDYVYFQDWDGWKRMSQVFDLDRTVTSNFNNEGQDEDILSDTFKYINDRALPGEALHYIAVQYLPALSITAAVRLTMPKSIILTNMRICVLEPKLMGESSLESYPLDQVENGMKRIKSGSKNGTFHIILNSGEWVEINKIPHAQLNQLVQLTRQLTSRTTPLQAVATV